MARLNIVKKYQGKRTCQHAESHTEQCGSWRHRDEDERWVEDPGCFRCDGTGVETITSDRCGLSKKEHAEPDPLPRYQHDFEPGHLRCGKCSAAIHVGTGYKFVKTRTPGQRSGTKRIRCMDCPSWKASELTSSPFLSTMYAADEDDPGYSTEGNPDDIAQELKDRAEHFGQAAREMAEIRFEAAQNIEEGFGHPTSQSEDLQMEGETAESAADELEHFEPDEYQAPAREDFDEEQDWIDECESSLANWADEIADEIDSMWGDVQ